MAGPASATSGDTVWIRGQLDIATGGLADQSVTVVALAGPTQYNVGTATTDSSGGFTIDDIPATNGTITYRATFAGSSDYEPSQGSADVTVTLQQQPSSLTISATEQSGRKNRGQYDLAASFTDGGPARPIAVYAQPASGGETLLATGTSVTLVVNPSETTTYVARFVGDAAYLPSEAATTVTVSTKGGGKPPKN